MGELQEKLTRNSEYAVDTKTGVDLFLKKKNLPKASAKRFFYKCGISTFI